MILLSMISITHVLPNNIERRGNMMNWTGSMVSFVPDGQVFTFF